MPTGVYKRTKEHIEILKMSHKRKNFGFQKGHKPYKGIEKGWLKKGNKNWLGKYHTENTKDKIRKANLGKKPSEETRRKLSESQKGERGSNWQGGIDLDNSKIRKGIELKLWRESIFARDNWTCQKYGTRCGDIHPHHIQNFAQYPELRFAIDNGITLSKKAHRDFHKKYGYKNNNKEQIIDFLNI